MIPFAKITENGVSVPTTEEVKENTWDFLKTCFGGDLAIDERTPQGQVMVGLVAMLQDRDAQFVEFVNQFDPSFAKGRFQDAIGNIYFLTRNQATSSIATVEFIGLNGTVIPQGFLLKDADGGIWQTTEQTTITNSIAKCTAESQVKGSIQAQENTITGFVQALSGLDRFTNPNPAIVGREQEKQRDFETRRAQSVQKNSQFIDSALRAEIANLDGVIDVYVRSNFTDQSTTFGVTNYPVVRNSICVSVVGGKDSEIAWAMLEKGGTGASFNGNTNPTVYDKESFPENPIAYKVVKFIRPKEKRIYFKIIISDYSTLSASSETQIKQAILSSFSTGNNKAKIGQKLTAFQYACIVNSIDAGVISIELSVNKTQWLSVLELGIDEFPVCSLNDILIESRK